MSRKLLVLATCLSLAVASGIGAQTATVDPAIQGQIDAIKGVLPKFAIPMREVGQRFEDMYYAAKGGNWGLAAYMSSYMNKALGPATLTKPDEYPMWVAFYTNSFADANKAIAAQDFKAFDKAWNDARESCDACHVALGYPFIKVVKAASPADSYVDYNFKSKASDLHP